MLDDLREQADSAEFLEEEGDFFGYDEAPSMRAQLFMGMTPVQRFVIAVMILMMTCILSSFCLLVTEKIAPPFL
jgi:hypothetical protein